MLKYAHENGCEWDNCVCFYAAKNNNLEMLKYAHENNWFVETENWNIF